MSFLKRVPFCFFKIWFLQKKQIFSLVYFYSLFNQPKTNHFFSLLEKAFHFQKDPPDTDYPGLFIF